MDSLQEQVPWVRCAAQCSWSTKGYRFQLECSYTVLRALQQRAVLVVFFVLSLRVSSFHSTRNNLMAVVALFYLFQVIY